MNSLIIILSAGFFATVACHPSSVFMLPGSENEEITGDPIFLNFTVNDERCLCNEIIANNGKRTTKCSPECIEKGLKLVNYGGTRKECFTGQSYNKKYFSENCYCFAKLSDDGKISTEDRCSDEGFKRRENFLKLKLKELKEELNSSPQDNVEETFRPTPFASLSKRRQIKTVEYMQEHKDLPLECITGKRLKDEEDCNGCGCGIRFSKDGNVDISVQCTMMACPDVDGYFFLYKVRKMLMRVKK